ncbi:cation transporting ATPase C-terminal domain-containing protein [Nitrosomonas sp. Is37]|uniref:P-type ATPase n=1 Tax=Nitrosomonas sp. Is37 TaxID=3080535 RepID=UPI00294B10E0|nr:cation transporting ATPase C-terminal domain-containing protein [Nitrosomonas sp. Is37]MDV6344496.1 cation transporting ATPase C-terminal domain-containing protein [Nitrosomonas sp. Is37]
MQEYRAERAVAALKQMVRIRHDEITHLLSAIELVPGNIVLLEAGNMVSADIHLLEATDLEVDEAALTCESMPVSKIIAPILDKNAILAERHNMLFRGTLTTRGRATGVVTATGMLTPNLALSQEKAEQDIMQRPPRHPRESIFAHGMWQTYFMNRIADWRVIAVYASMGLAK